MQHHRVVSGYLHVTNGCHWCIGAALNTFLARHLVLVCCAGVEHENGCACMQNPSQAGLHGLLIPASQPLTACFTVHKVTTIMLPGYIGAFCLSFDQAACGCSASGLDVQGLVAFCSTTTIPTCICSQSCGNLCAAEHSLCISMCTAVVAVIKQHIMVTLLRCVDAADLCGHNTACQPSSVQVHVFVCR